MTNLQLKNPLAFFDLETTGVNVTQDRIVEIAIIKMMPGGGTEEKTWRVNPERPIPEEVSLIHGIYDKDVKDAPTFKEIAPEVLQFLDKCDLAGFNSIRFDLPVLTEAFLREDMSFDISRRKLVDAQKIFFLMEKRTLSAAYQYYCGEELENAHSAHADALATMKVLLAQVERYQDQPVEDTQGNVVGTIRNDVASLHTVSVANMVDLAGRFVYNEQGVAVMNFGKHKNKPVIDVLNSEPAFYDWMMKGDFSLDTKQKLTEIRLKSLQSKFNA